jgi:hypothetical protein
LTIGPLVATGSETMEGIVGVTHGGKNPRTRHGGRGATGMKRRETPQVPIWAGFHRQRENSPGETMMTHPTGMPETIGLSLRTGGRLVSDRALATTIDVNITANT